MQYLDSIVGFLKKVTELAIALLALAIVLQILFGNGVSFIGVDVIGNVTKIISSLGSNGLVGLIAAAVLYGIVTRK
jgi:hypothetical protein